MNCRLCPRLVLNWNVPGYFNITWKIKDNYIEYKNSSSYSECFLSADKFNGKISQMEDK